jgi:quinol monooxygenase YgiN
VIVIAGHLHVPAAERDRYVTHHRDLLERGRAFPGCLELAISPDPVDPRRVNTLEVWTSADALDTWRAQAGAPDHGIAVLDLAVKRYDATDGGSLF